MSKPFLVASNNKGNSCNTKYVLSNLHTCQGFSMICNLNYKSGGVYVSLSSSLYFTLITDTREKRKTLHLDFSSCPNSNSSNYARTADFRRKAIFCYLPLSFWSSSFRSGPACMKILSDTGFLSVRDSLLVFTMAVQFSNATSPFLRKQFIAGYTSD